MRMKDRMKRFLMEVLGLHEEGLVERIIGISCIKHYTKGRTLYNQGEKVDTCGFLMEGVIGAFIYTKSGKQITDDFSYLPGEMITPLADEKKRALTSAVALTEVDAFVIPNMDAEALFKAYPELHHLLFVQMMQCYRKQWELKNTRYQMAAKERYLSFLERYRGLEDVVSDRHLASFLNMSPETLSRQKRSLREKKPD